MTIEEYLVDVKRIYYQMSVIVKGKQILATGNTTRMTDIRVRDSKGRLGTVRFSTLSLPASTKVDRIGTGCAAIDFGGVHLVIWPVKEMSNA